MRFLNSRRYFRVKHREFLERSPEEYQITEDDVPLLKSGRPWIRDPHFTRKEKLHYVRNETQLGLILFDEGRKAVRR